MVLVPDRLATACHRTEEGGRWLERLPDAIRDVQGRWALALERPFDGPEVSCAWVAPGVRGDGTRVVLKLGMAHMEGLHELDGLRFWNGDPTPRLCSKRTLRSMPCCWSDANRAPLCVRCRRTIRMSWSRACSVDCGAGRRRSIPSVHSQ